MQQKGHLGVGASHQYKLLIILSPSGAYYGGETLKPTKIYVEDEYVRAVRGGVGFAKVAGNYARQVCAKTNANKLGYDQVLWLDGVEQKYIEEVGTRTFSSLKMAKSNYTRVEWQYFTWYYT